MSKRRVPSSGRKTSQAPRKLAGVKKRAKKADPVIEDFAKSGYDKSKVHRFVGISLSGGKADKACVAVIEYYSLHKKIFLARLYEKIKTEEFISAFGFCLKSGLTWVTLAGGNLVSLEGVW